MIGEGRFPGYYANGWEENQMCKHCFQVCLSELPWQMMWRNSLKKMLSCYTLLSIFSLVEQSRAVAGLFFCLEDVKKQHDLECPSD